MLAEWGDDERKLTDRVSVLVGAENGLYPSGNTLLVRGASEAVVIDPEHVWSLGQLARLLERSGRDADALTHYRTMLDVNREGHDGLRGVAWILATTAVDGLRDGESATKLAEQLDGLTDGRSTLARYTLAAAYAAAGRFEEAVAALNQTLTRLTPAERQWAPELRRCLELYEAGSTYRPPPARE